MSPEWREIRFSGTPGSDMTKTDVLKFVDTLESEYQAVFDWADSEVVVIRDTLSGEFQVASRIVSAYWDQARTLYEAGVRW